MRKLLCILLTMALCLPLCAMAEEPAIDFSYAHRGTNYSWYVMHLNDEPWLEEAYAGGELAGLPTVSEHLKKGTENVRFAQLSDDTGILYEVTGYVSYLVRVEDGLARYYGCKYAMANAMIVDGTTSGVNLGEGAYELNGNTVTWTDTFTGVASEGEITVYSENVFEWRGTGEPLDFTEVFPDMVSLWFLAVNLAYFAE